MKGKEREQILENELHKFLDGLLICNRVWEAWGVGTMTQDDFESADNEDIYSELKFIIKKHLKIKGANKD